MTTLPPPPATLTTDWTDQDLGAYVRFCDDLLIGDVSVPLQVWANESNCKASAHNTNGDASGIFQLMPSTAKDIGYPVAADPHLAAFRALGVAGQLVWAERYYNPHRGQISTVARFYLCTFLPALLSCADDPNHVLAGKDGPLAWAYNANWVSFDPGHATGTITPASLVAAAHRATGPRTRELISRAQAYGPSGDT
jgi:hypothetical protein